MVRYHYPSKVKRGICFIIDALVVFGFGFFISFLIKKFTGFQDYFESAKAVGLEKIFVEPFSSESIECVRAIVSDISISSGSYLLIIVIYLIIMPLCISWQTFGRLITKTRLLVRRKNTNPTIWHLLLRELVGEFLLYVVFTLLLKYWNMFFFISVGYCFLQDISIPDLISKTKIVKKDPTIEEEFEFKAEDYKYTDDYDWEAESTLEGEKNNEDVTSEK